MTALTGCSGKDDRGSSPPDLVPANALDGVLLSTNEIDSLTGSSGMVAHPRVQTMSDHRNLLPNLNCLGIWQVNEAGVYGSDGWIALRQELLRSPDTDDWHTLVVQSVVNYPSTDAARDFFAQSADRWSKCTNHNVNITLNDKPLPKWRSGDLTKTDAELAIPFTRRTATGVESCQRVLAVANNVVIDVQACTRDASTVTEAAAVADAIESKLLR
ncbi:sensor domain-containing protein [Mycolicibacterium hodleri]|uniref:sensor domain-containing protein n=1 Tax=Mycolicibacterium hodleri TaxID=49897 RepID=UPI001F1CF1FF|nr:sensor domain-containing protein [Mycolicibacterium hodleri]